MSDIKSNIKRYRMLAKLTQAELAKILGVTTPYLSKIERGKNIPSFDLLYKFSKALHVPLEYFIEDDSNRDYLILTAIAYSESINEMSSENDKFIADYIKKLFYGE